ncbi:leucine-rich repeat domain-containing protein [[Mycoplasma] collis]|uniref:leucine-rich repeat domain-containing protein n=1 Tax=[Mycoplasma] collis TaxID=2127 RepID=UPI00051B11C8|nr:leucine-rich repeat domain-containing protein [[Mycoplasma] collis]
MELLTKKEAKNLLKDSNYFNKNILDLSELKNVTKIDDFAFANCKFLIYKLILPINLKTIGIGAFAFNKISSIVFNKNLEYIEESAFENNLIEIIEFNEKLKKIGDFAFSKNKIKNIEFKKELNILSEGSFADNDIEFISFQNPQTNIENFPFWNNINIKTISFYNCINKITYLNKNSEYFNLIELKIINSLDDFNNVVKFNHFNILQLLKHEELSQIKNILYYADKKNNNSSININVKFRELDFKNIFTNNEIKEIKI